MRCSAGGCEGAIGVRGNPQADVTYMQTSRLWRALVAAVHLASPAEAWSRL